jgi:pimeloyl-ACP methyl ester carboxylesterase
MPTINAPEAIRLFSDPAFSRLARAIAASPQLTRWLYFWQVGRFITNPATRAQTLATLWPEFIASVPAFVSLNRDLNQAVVADTARVPELSSLNRPVRIIWGARDPYLNSGMARSFHELLPTSQLYLLPARHYVQVDAPARVAQLLLTVPLAR